MPNGKGIFVSALQLNDVFHIHSTALSRVNATSPSEIRNQVYDRLTT